MYNIPQTAFEDALKEQEVESESDVEEEKELEMEQEGDGREFVAAESDDESDDIDAVRMFQFFLL